MVPQKIQEIGGVLAVMDRKGRIKSNLIGIAAQQPGTDRMEGAGPAQCFGHTGGALSDHGTDDPLDPPNHLVGGPSRERHQKDPPWIRPAHDQMRQGARRPRIAVARDFSARASTAKMCHDWALALRLAISVSNREGHSVVQLELPLGLEDEGRRPGSRKRIRAGWPTALSTRSGVA